MQPAQQRVNKQQKMVKIQGRMSDSPKSRCKKNIVRKKMVIRVTITAQAINKLKERRSAMNANTYGDRTVSDSNEKSKGKKDDKYLS